MTRTERKAIRGKHTRKLFKKVIYAIALITGGVLSSVITGDGTALVIILFFVTPLFFTARRIYIK